MPKEKSETSFEIKGIITVPKNMRIDEFVEQFIELIESKEWVCFGIYNEVREDEETET